MSEALSREGAALQILAAQFLLDLASGVCLLDGVVAEGAGPQVDLVAHKDLECLAIGLRHVLVPLLRVEFTT